LIVHSENSADRKTLFELPAWFKLIVCSGLSISAFATRTPSSLLLLILVNAGVLILFQGHPVSFWREAKMFLCQTVIITVLYAIRFGFPEAIVPALTVSLQLFLALYPGIIFIHSTPQSQIVKTLSYIMPDRFAFVLSTSIKFVPLIFGETREIYEVQVLRGARVLPRDLIRPWNWPDLVSCIVVPAIIRCLVMAGEIAVAAQARGFGTKKKRTCWPCGHKQPPKKSHR
jgi:energy-coupling factor transport system permease protein